MSYLSTLDNYEVFANYSHPSKEEVFHYLDLMYNFESQLIQDYQDVAMRKKVAAVEAGLDHTQEWVKNILLGLDTEFNGLILCYIGQVQNNATFQMLVTAEEYFLELNQVINEKVKKMSITDDKTVTTMKGKGDLMNRLDETRMRISVLRKELYRKDLGLDPEKPLQIRQKLKPESVNV